MTNTKTTAFDTVSEDTINVPPTIPFPKCGTEFPEFDFVLEVGTPPVCVIVPTESGDEICGTPVPIENNFHDLMA